MNQSVDSSARATAPPWRTLLLDRDRTDPKWIMATVALPLDVRPAVLDIDGRYTGWQSAAHWVAGSVGRHASLSPMDALVWAIREGISW